MSIEGYISLCVLVWFGVGAWLQGALLLSRYMPGKSVKEKADNAIKVIFLRSLLGLLSLCFYFKEMEEIGEEINRDLEKQREQ